MEAFLITLFILFVSAFCIAAFMALIISKENSKRLERLEEDTQLIDAINSLRNTIDSATNQAATLAVKHDIEFPSTVMANSDGTYTTYNHKHTMLTYTWEADMFPILCKKISENQTNYEWLKAFFSNKEKELEAQEPQIKADYGDIEL